MLLSEASEAFLAVRRQERFSRHTISAYQLQYRILTRDIGDQDIRDVDLIEFPFATGCRVAEIQRLDRQDIDWHRGAVMVLGKGELNSKYRRPPGLVIRLFAFGFRSCALPTHAVHNTIMCITLWEESRYANRNQHVTHESTVKPNN